MIHIGKIILWLPDADEYVVCQMYRNKGSVY
jgi:hypothetical protein